MNQRHEALKEHILQRISEMAEIEKQDEKEYAVYQEELKIYWDLYNVIDFAEKNAKLEIAIKIARTAIQQGLSNEMIKTVTGLSLKEIEGLR